MSIGPSHDPTAGCLCLCLACTADRLDALNKLNSRSSQRAADQRYLDGDYDLIGSYRRFEWGE